MCFAFFEIKHFEARHLLQKKTLDVFRKVIVLIIYVNYLGKQKNVLFETIRIVLWWKAMETILLFPLTSFYYKSVNYFARDQRSDPSLPLKGIFFCETNPDPLHKSLLIFALLNLLAPSTMSFTFFSLFHLRRHE